MAFVIHCQPVLDLGNELVWVLWEEGHTPCEQELHCMMGKTAGGHSQETVKKATWHYAEGEEGCLGLGCDTDNWC